jgi:putative transposase
MDNVKLIEMLAQAENGTVQGVFEDFIRGTMRYAFVEAMCEEVEGLCGPRHKRAQNVDSKPECYRAGNAWGVAFFGTDSEEVKRPRVRRRTATGASQEEPLKTYEAGKQGDALRKTILRCFVAGVSTRKIDEVAPSGRRTSKSEVARQWESKGAEYIAALRERSFADDAYVVLMLDGVVLSDTLIVIVALGVTDGGEKKMLDFEIGSSENAETAEALTDRLVAHGFRLAARRPLALLDGSKALRRAVVRHWPEAAIQTCLVHVARGIRGKLARRWHGELERLFKRLREASSSEAAREALDALEHFVASHSAEGLKKLETAREEMLTLFTLDVPDTFNKPLLSTNSIENSIRNMRRLLGRVTRWRAETDMASRWMACAMLEAEKGFRRIQGYRQMGLLIEALNRNQTQEKKTETELIGKEEDK